jgi:hypothetical protein
MFNVHGFDAYVVLPGYEKDERIRYYHPDCFKKPEETKEEKKCARDASNI